MILLPLMSLDKFRSEIPSQMLFVKRGDNDPYLLMTDVTCKNESWSTDDGPIILSGNLCDGHTFTELQQDDCLIYLTDVGEIDSVHCDMGAVSDTLLTSFDCEATELSLASEMPKRYLLITDVSNIGMLDTANRINSALTQLYDKYPAYQHIMVKSENEITPISLGALAAKQTPERQMTIISLLLTLSRSFIGETSYTIIKHILELCQYDEELTLLTQEEQVAAFIEFSKKVAGKKTEYVPDTLIEDIKISPEYQQVLEKLADNGLGISKTQQFNVFQTVGYMSNSLRANNIIYNLSDMGAGKTLMTVESIYLLDLKNISTWGEQQNELISEDADIEICDIRVPDKHIIAPTLSVKSSWIDTFKLFYDVTETDEDFKYELSCTFNGITAHSTIYVSPFTVKNGSIFNSIHLPEPKFHPYLIIDEIHQLIKKKLAKTKFFYPKTLPNNDYKTFILSGTMSNLKTNEWFNFLSFMGIETDPMTPCQYADSLESLRREYIMNVKDGTRDIRKEAHRYFDAPPIAKDQYYNVSEPEKMTSKEKYFYMRYGSQALHPLTWATTNEKGRNVDDILCNSSLVVNPVETDAINFELFYKIVGSRAITAQSIQIAEELFGEQKTQHVSDVIKTASPLSQDDINILKVLHHIAADCDKYKSLNIAKAINNGILNLNDGLQTKNLYELIAGFAERNLRFFEYLSTLDVNVLEKLQASGLINSPKLQETQKFEVLKNILASEPNETHLIVVNDFYALKSLSEALEIEYISKNDLKDELNYQTILDNLFEKQSIVVVTQDMIKSSLDLVQANRLVQYQLNTEISDIIQTQNRINRIGQTRETKGYYIATDVLQENLIELFLESYRNIRVAHKGIVELFVDITKQINVVNDYLEKAFMAIDMNTNEEAAEVVEAVEAVEETVDVTEEAVEETAEVVEETTETVEAVEEAVEEIVEETVATADKDILDNSDLISENALPKGEHVAVDENGFARALLYPQNGEIMVFVPLTTGTAFLLGQLNPIELTAPKEVLWDLKKTELGGVAA